MSQLPKRGNKITLQRVNVIEDIENKVYVLDKEDMTGIFFLLEQPSFQLPPQIYGNTIERADLTLKRFDAYQKNLGILLAGIKGTGKSLLAKTICTKADMPVIIIAKPFDSQSISELLNGVINKKCIVFIDEIDKVYEGKNNSGKLLTLLDGLPSSHPCLFLMTCNKLDSLHNCMLNRPGRCHYLYNYDGLEMEVVNQYIQDNLKHKEFENELAQFCLLYHPLSIDILQAVVEEINFQQKGIREVLDVLNISIQQIQNKYDVELYEKHSKISYHTTSTFNPLEMDGEIFVFQVDSLNQQEMEFYKSNRVVEHDEWGACYSLKDNVAKLWSETHPGERNLFHHKIRKYNDKKNYFVKRVKLHLPSYELKVDGEKLVLDNEQHIMFMTKQPLLNFYKKKTKKMKI